MSLIPIHLLPMGCQGASIGSSHLLPLFSMEGQLWVRRSDLFELLATDPHRKLTKIGQANQAPYAGRRSIYNHENIRLVKNTEPKMARRSSNISIYTIEHAAEILQMNGLPIASFFSRLSPLSTAVPLVPEQNPKRNKLKPTEGEGVDCEHSHTSSDTAKSKITSEGDNSLQLHADDSGSGVDSNPSREELSRNTPPNRSLDEEAGVETSTDRDQDDAETESMESKDYFPTHDNTENTTRGCDEDFEDAESICSDDFFPSGPAPKAHSSGDVVELPESTHTDSLIATHSLSKVGRPKRKVMNSNYLQTEMNEPMSLAADGSYALGRDFDVAGKPEKCAGNTAEFHPQRTGSGQPYSSGTTNTTRHSSSVRNPAVDHSDFALATAETLDSAESAILTKKPRCANNRPFYPMKLKLKEFGPPINVLDDQVQALIKLQQAHASGNSFQNKTETEQYHQRAVSRSPDGLSAQRPRLDMDLANPKPPYHSTDVEAGDLAFVMEYPSTGSVQINADVSNGQADRSPLPTSSSAISPRQQCQSDSSIAHASQAGPIGGANLSTLFKTQPEARKVAENQVLIYKQMQGRVSGEPKPRRKNYKISLPPGPTPFLDFSQKTKTPAAKPAPVVVEEPKRNIVHQPAVGRDATAQNPHVSSHKEAIHKTSNQEACPWNTQPKPSPQNTKAHREHLQLAFTIAKNISKYQSQSEFHSSVVKLSLSIANEVIKIKTTQQTLAAYDRFKIMQQLEQEIQAQALRLAQQTRTNPPLPTYLSQIQSDPISAPIAGLPHIQPTPQPSFTPQPNAQIKPEIFNLALAIAQAISKR
eukprot:TRINITY_DN3651_c0_g2_i1.p1 TRINITY_DN3651_c0_g2~~TRINITY_DN3651_c0_g2_i1.p1  ORF type:complete len:816 (+),score=137.63 TRINITY_DN3651_c0_g2_i1:197-2644(+)